MEIGCYSAAVVQKPIKEKLTALKEIGYDFLELALGQKDVDALNDGEMNSIVADSKAVGLPIRSLSLGAFSGFADACKEADTRKAKFETIEKAIDLAGRCGAEVILCASWEPAGGSGAMERYVKYMPELADKAAKKNVKLAIEHIGGSVFLNSPAGVRKIVSAINHPNVGVYFDIGNAFHAGEDPVLALSKMGKHLFQIHLKGIGDRPLERMPLDAVLEQLEAMNYRGRGATEVLKKDATDNEFLAEALRTLRAHGF